MNIALLGRFGESDIITGPERVARELYFELKNKNIQVVFIEYFFSGYEESSIFKKLFGKKYFDNKSIRRLGLFPLIFTFLQNEYDIIHVINSQRFILFLVILKKIISGKLVTTFHGLMHNEIPKNHHLTKRYFIDFWVESLLVKKSELIIFPSKLLYDAFNKRYNISSKQYQIIPNGISKIFYFDNKPFTRIDDTLKMIFYNGIDTSIDRGLSELLELLKDISCKIELCVITKRTNVNINNSNIKLSFVEPMSHPELIEILKEKHFILKSNKFDTFSIIVGECMSLGLIPIVYENIGMKDFIKNEVNGFIYSENSRNSLPNLIDNISRGNYNLIMISANARKIYDELNWNKVTDQYLAGYKSVQ